MNLNKVLFGFAGLYLLSKIIDDKKNYIGKLEDFYNPANGRIDAYWGKDLFPKNLIVTSPEVAWPPPCIGTQSKKTFRKNN